MAPKGRVALKNVKSLTFHSGEHTQARRTEPIPQLQCHGKACRRYQPDVVQCSNMGDDGAGSVQWKCDADLPEGMRFGRVEVSCEGWTRAGDPNILQGSCGLSYDLVTIDPGLERGEYDYPFDRLRRSASDDLLSTVAQVVAVLTTVFVLYQLLSKLVRWLAPALGGGGGRPGGGGGGGGGGGPGFGGGQSPPPPPPPPYSKEAPSTSTPFPPGAPAQQQPAPGTGGMTPGFWTGLAAGGAATYLLNRRNEGQATGGTAPTRRGARRVDWDDPDDRGVGPSTGGGGGGMRRATAFGSSSTR